jgi:hypothetical protein
LLQDGEGLGFVVHVDAVPIDEANDVFRRVTRPLGDSTHIGIG